MQSTRGKKKGGMLLTEAIIPPTTKKKKKIGRGGELGGKTRKKEIRVNDEMC